MLVVFKPEACNYSTCFLLFPVDLICIQKSNLNSSLSVRIPGHSTLRSDCAYFRCGYLSSDDSNAGNVEVIFVKQGLTFPELSISSLSSLSLCSDYAGVIISPKISSPISYLDIYALLTRFSSADCRINYFSPSVLPFSKNLFNVEDFMFHHPQWDLTSTSDPHGKSIRLIHFL